MKKDVINLTGEENKCFLASPTLFSMTPASVLEIVCWLWSSEESLEGLS